MTEQKTDHLDIKIPRWFALYTHSRQEKKVYEQIKKLGIEAYLPLRKELRQWSDRKKWVELPLFSSYVFVKVTSAEYIEIPKRVTGFMAYVIIRGNRISIRDSEIETIRLMLESDPTDIEIIRYQFSPGDKVEIISGPLIGRTAELVEEKGKRKVAIRLESLESALAITIDTKYLKPIK